MKIEQPTIASLKENALSADTKKETRLKKACNDFEAIFVKQMLSAMRQSVPKDGLFGNNGYEQEIFQSMQDDELAKSISSGRGMGISEVLYNQVSGKTTQTTHQGQNNVTIK